MRVCAVNRVDIWRNGEPRIYVISDGRVTGDVGLTQNYGDLAKEREAPLWPIFAGSVSIPLGIVIVFGSILWSK
jgi:hypothetical protein